MAHTGPLIGVSWYAAGLLGVCLSFRKHNIWTLLWVLLFGLSLGWWRGSVYMMRLAAYEPLYFQKVTITAQATEDAVYGKNSQLSFDTHNVRLSDGQSLAGRIELSGFGLNAAYQGDIVQATGKLYPAFGAYQGRISFAKLTILSHHPTLIADVRRRFTAGVQSALLEPLAPFAMALLISQRATLPANIKQDLLMVGLTHIIAVSGYNLTIMLDASKRLLGKRSKRLSTLLSLGLMAIFLLLAGASASIARAAIVSTLSIVAGYYGRSFKPLNLIALAAALTAWANPFYIWSDTSWYLSFLAFFGVMVLAPLLATRFRTRWQNSLVAMVALESICAEAMTLPFVLHTFGQMSFIGLPANVLVVTLVPLAMLLSTVAGLAGMLAGNLAGWFAWPARLLLTYMLDVAHLLARLPHIFVQHLGFSIPQMVSMYVVAMALVFALRGSTNGSEYAKITDRNESEERGITKA